MFYSVYLYLKDGSVFKGWSLFNDFISFGEIVFNTSMTGYQEVLTDPSYTGQIILFTYPEIGNTGLNNLDNESSSIYLKGIIAKNLSLFESNWRSIISLRDYIIMKRIPHIFGLDTRSIAKYIRNNGVMSCCITTYMHIDFVFPSIDNLDLIRRITTKQIYYVANNRPYLYNYNNACKLVHTNSSINIVLIDFGVKYNIIALLKSYGCNVYVLPAMSDYKMISYYKPDGIVLSNGPGNPANIPYAINTVIKLLDFSNIPIFGICMGHQVLSLALGAQTFKLKFGHRGVNHPAGIKQSSNITSQNHGFAIKIDNKINNKWLPFTKVTYRNLNDFTIAGILFNNKPIFSVQYHPEASPGPRDSDYLFSSFIDLVNIVKSL